MRPRSPSTNKWVRGGGGSLVDDLWAKLTESRQAHHAESLVPSLQGRVSDEEPASSSGCFSPTRCLISGCLRPPARPGVPAVSAASDTRAARLAACRVNALRKRARTAHMCDYTKCYTSTYRIIMHHGGDETHLTLPCFSGTGSIWGMQKLPGRRRVALAYAAHYTPSLHALPSSMPPAQPGGCSG